MSFTEADFRQGYRDLPRAIAHFERTCPPLKTSAVALRAYLEKFLDHPEIVQLRMSSPAGGLQSWPRKDGTR